MATPEQPQQPIVADETPPPVVLPACAAQHHIAPNICLRSPLFGIYQRRGRENLGIVKNLQIASFNGHEISFTGQRLNQGDFEVFVQMVRIAADRQDHTGLLRFSVREIIAALGRSYGKFARQAILDSFSRLQAGQISIVITRDGRRVYTYKGSLVDKFTYSHEEKTYLLRLNNDLTGLFNIGFTKLDWQQRLSLNSDLAKWLHGYFASNRSSFFPVRVRRLYELCGSHSQTKEFRRSIRIAMEELQRTGCIRSWKIDVHGRVQIVFSSPTQSEQPASRQPIIVIPLIKKDGEFPVYQQDIDQWQETFPGIDAKKALRRIAQWNHDNPSRRKTMSGIRRHISIWLGRDQDTANPTEQNGAVPSPRLETNEANAIAESEARRTREYLNSLYSEEVG